MGEVSEAERADLVEMISGAWKTRVIGEAVSLGLFDALADGPKASDALARATGADADGLFRLLRALATLDLLRHEAGDVFALTPRGALLRRDAPDSLSGMAGHWSERLWSSFAAIGESVRTGAPCIASGPDHFEASQADVEAADVFNRAMAEGSLRVGRALARVYDFAGVSRLMDVGGGYGALLVGPLEAHQRLTGTVYDLPSLAPRALAYLAEQGLGGRSSYLGGSFFEQVPAGADCILLKYILHDWNDARCVQILRNCRAAVGDGTILIIERIVPETVGPGDAEVIRGDLTMLTVGGRERTRAEYRALLAEAGLELRRVLPIDPVFSAIEAKAV